eukprot:144724-Alexandrium_andersonii.AAC.1
MPSSKLIARLDCRFTIRPPLTPKSTSSRALARVLAARKGRFAAATWNRTRRRCFSLAKKPSSTSP